MGNDKNNKSNAKIDTKTDTTKAKNKEKVRIVRSRFEEEMDKLALEFSSSIKDDEKIFYYDLLVDFAHVIGLYKMKHLTKEEAKEILLGLMKIRDDGFSKLDVNYEDIHEAIEAALSKITDKATKMHTARSRNDEVAACLRLFARDRLLAIMFSLIELRKTILDLAKENIETIMPGFTHLQYAQPTRLSHHLLAYHDMLKRDYERALECFKRVNLCPLGAAAFASTSFRLDRGLTAKLLGFDGIVENSMDAAASRDFAIESIFVCSSIMLSLSRIAEEIVLWSSEFDFMELADSYASSSSIMPQKKNPDIAELIRARAARICGNLTSAMMIYKAMPFAYNRDFQEMNPLLYFSLESAELCTILISRMLETARLKREKMEEKASKGFSTATDIADLLVQKAGIPFRLAHRIVGYLASHGIENPSLGKLIKAAEETAEPYVSAIKDKISEEDLKFDAEKAVESRKNVGSPSKVEVERMIAERIKILEKDQNELESRVERVSESLEMLYKEIQGVVEL
ncbi:MAG: argininosuccinate lyase [Archaeoglobus sp.]|nr:argininosuccinate lyase [Archaeoglobus sp.]